MSFSIITFRCSTQTFASKKWTININQSCHQHRLSCLIIGKPTSIHRRRCISHSYPLFQSTKNPTHDNVTSTTNTNIIKHRHQPPLPIRISLVSSTTALATPSFPALGFLYLVLRITIPNEHMRQAMVGQWGTVLSFTTWTILPTLHHGSVASIMVPFALGNAVVAGSLYGIVDLACGEPNNNNSNKILQTPYICGLGIGASVGYIAPKYLYGPIMEHLYGLDGMTQSMQTIMSDNLTTVAGILLHPMLYYPTHGIKV